MAPDLETADTEHLNVDRQYDERNQLAAPMVWATARLSGRDSSTLAIPQTDLHQEQGQYSSALNLPQRRWPVLSKVSASAPATSDTAAAPIRCVQ